MKGLSVKRTMMSSTSGADRIPSSVTGGKERVTETTVKRRNEGTGSKTETRTESKTTRTGGQGGSTSSSTTTKTTQLGGESGASGSSVRKKYGKGRFQISKQ